ncbi:HpcH/HpaI aldolase/citrate lyase family protein [Streptomyces sp. BE230]|uniref:HpcH/HpaI aldolase/citrate lyase family protein n=1 Tax=Streptomyces sp. BE230 TaxID=3002526 RepID=UPI002ED2CD0D|nr:CoA ester lyase [Streptomyces sp. BE230]
MTALPGTRYRRPRRSCLSVPGSSPRYLEKAQHLPCDHVFLDLEDSVTAELKDQARCQVIEALCTGDWSGKVTAVRINEPLSPWAFRDVSEIVAHAGDRLDAVLLPKTETPAHVHWLDIQLTQLERAHRLPVGRIGIEAHLESARGIVNSTVVAASSPRLEALVFGTGDYSASVGIAHLSVGDQPDGYPGDAFHHPLTSLLLSARTHGLQAIDGAYFQIGDADGFRRSARTSAALGFDGKVVLHPSQIEAANDIYVPGQEQYDHAELVLDAHDYCCRVLGRGAAMLGAEMIDEASRKLAALVAAKGRAAHLERTRDFDPSRDLAPHLTAPADSHVTA